MSDVIVTASEGKVRIHAPVIELISGNGSYIRLDNNIELGSPTDVTIKAPDVHVRREASLHADIETRDPPRSDDPVVIYGSKPHDELLKGGGQQVKATT